MEPTCTGMVSPGFSPSPILPALCPIFLSLQQPDSDHDKGDTAELHELNVGENGLFCPISISRPYKQVSIVDICLRVYNG